MKKNHNKLVPEVRSFGELRAISEENSRTVEGYAAVFNKRSLMLWDWGGSFYEEIAPGAFDGVLDNDVRALLNHDPNHLLARTKSGTLQIEQDENGLKFRFDIPQSREDVLEMIQRGDLDENSFAFRVEDDEWRTEGDVDVRTIKKVKELMDVTLATYPAYPDAKLQSAKRSYDAWKENEKPEENTTNLENEHRERSLRLHSHLI